MSDGRWKKIPVPLAWFQAKDEACSAPNALEDAWGDRFLCANNPVYARVRNAAVELGFRYSCEDTPLWRAYQCSRLTSLPRILRERTIPYLNTGWAVRTLIEERPDIRLPMNFVSTGVVEGNRAFHESAHAVADAALGEMSPPGRDRYRWVLNAVLAESYATAVERFAATFDADPLPDLVFFGLNSYARKGEESEKLKAALSGLAADRRFAVLLLAMFEANVSASPSDAETTARVSEAAQCEPSEYSAVDAVLGVAFALNMGFRDATTPAFFEALGFADEYRRLATARWLADPEGRLFAREAAARLGEVADPGAPWNRIVPACPLL